MKTKTLSLLLFCSLFSLLILSDNPSVLAKDPHPCAAHENELRILVILGGSKSYSKSFTDIFTAMPGVKSDTLSQPLANKALLSDSIYKYKVLVFYDMTQNITETQKERFIELTERGTGLVFLHHSLVSYQEWDTFKHIIGGKYYEKKYNYPPEKISDYRHDLILQIKVLAPDHPVTNGINDFVILDEGYSNIEILPGITPLLATDHSHCSEIIAWSNIFNNSKIVYLLMGHDKHAHNNENYRRLIYNSVKWTMTVPTEN